MVRSQEKVEFALESVSCEGGVWLEQQDWEEAEFKYFSNQGPFLAQFPFHRHSNRRQQQNLKFRSNRMVQSKAVSVTKTWIFKASSGKLMDLATFECRLADYRIGHLVWVTSKLQDDSIKRLRFLVSAAYIGMQLDAVHTFPRLGEVNGFHQFFTHKSDVLLGGSDEFTTVLHFECDKMSWFNHDETLSDQKKLSYLVRRSERFAAYEEKCRVAQYAEPKKTGLVARFFRNPFRASDPEGWQRWSKRKPE